MKKEKVKKPPRQETAFTMILKFVPILILATLIIVFKLEIMVAAAISCIVAGAIAIYINRKSVDDIVDIMAENSGKVAIVYLILMLAYCVAESFMRSGVGASIINISLKFGISGRTVAPVAFLVCCVLSVATGSSWGTFAACAPIFLWLNYIVNGNIVLTACAVAGGACFGDNIGLISDTTVVSSGLNGVDIIDRVRHQGAWSIGCVVITAALFFAFSMKLPGEVGSAEEAINAIPPEAWAALEEERPSAIVLLNQVKAGVPYYMVIPMLVVVGLAVTGISTMICLGAGIISAVIFGMIANTCTLSQLVNDILPNGFADAGSFSVALILWITAFSGIVASMDAFAPLGRLVVKCSKNVRHLMTWNAVIALLCNAAFADEMAEITTSVPITRALIDDNVEGSEEDLYKLRLRNATFADALGVYGSQLIPWHCYIAFYVSLSNAIFPMYQFKSSTFITHNIMAIVACASIIILTLTGLDRFIPGFKLPSEPKVHLRKMENTKA